MSRSRPRVFRVARYHYLRFLRRLDRETPEWARWLTPYGTSLAIHAFGLLLLTIVVTALGVDEDKKTPAMFSGQLTDDISSSEMGDQSGDPFTTLTTDEPPSLSLEAAPSPSADIILPKLADSTEFGPLLNPTAMTPSGLSAESIGPALSSTGRGLGSLRGNVSGEFDPRLPMMAPFSGRQEESRARMVRREGGTVESEKAVELGLAWIARHQRTDGSWGLDTSSSCGAPGCPATPAMTSDTAATGLALLPLLGAGHTHTKKGRFQKTVERGLAFLVKSQKPSGEIYTGGDFNSLFYSHAIATMALCEAYGLTKDKRLKEPAQRAIFYINRNQNKADGGWRYAFGQEGDTSVVGWQVFAMRSAHLAGLEVNKAVLKRTREFLDRVSTDKIKSSYAYLPGRGPSPTMTAEGLVCRQLLGWPKRNEGLIVGTASVFAHLEQSKDRNIYYWYYATQLLHNMRGKMWERWNTRVRDGLIAMQVTGKGCDLGSWDPINPQPDEWGSRAGRLYTTSLSLLTLEVYYRYLPLYRDEGEPMVGADNDAERGAGSGR